MKTLRFVAATKSLSLRLLLFCVLVASCVRSAAAAGWKPLFTGTNLDGWSIFLKDQNERNSDTNHLVQVEGGAIHMYKDAEPGSTQPFGYIATEKEYSNYHLRLQYRWGEKKFAPRAAPNARRDAGLLYHVGKDKVWPVCVECQIQEGDVGDIYAVSTQVTSPVDPKTTNGTPRVATNRATGVRTTNLLVQPVFLEAANGGTPFVQGAVGTSLRIIRQPMNEREGWNTLEIIVHGDRATHVVNGKLNNQCFHIKEQVDGQWVPLTHGRIALQLEGAEVLYRNIEIEEPGD